NHSFLRVKNIFYQIATNIELDDPLHFLQQEMPGFSNYSQRIIVAGEGTNYSNLPIESSPPLEEVLKDREAVFDDDDKEKKENKQLEQSTGDKDVVFIYNTHNRESFLPHLPDETDPDSSFHDEVNITKLNEKLKRSLKDNGIGTTIDETDIMNIMQGKEWTYGKSYDASLSVVEETVASDDDIQYIIDLHRDSLPDDKTTKKIDGKRYGK